MPTGKLAPPRRPRCAACGLRPVRDAVSHTGRPPTHCTICEGRSRRHDYVHDLSPAEITRRFDAALKEIRARRR